VLGLGVLIFPIAAVPMAVILVRQRLSGRPIRTPPGFVLWLLFLAAVLLGLAALDTTPSGTMSGSVADRLAGAGYRVVGYLCLTVLLLYAGNLRTSELSQRRLVRLLAWLFVVTVAGGLVGTFAGHLELTSPVEHLLPHGVRSKGFVQSLVHPYAAQVMDVGAGATPRPAAPWGYTNTWGNNVLLLIGWFIVAAWGSATSATPHQHRSRRTMTILAAAVLAVAVIPIVFSLNRGLWIGLAAAAGWVAVRLALRGRLAALLVIVGASGILAVVLATSPLGQTVIQRMDNGHSDGVRTFVTQRALAGVAESPVIGFGSTRNTLGGRNSIAVGPTAECERCGAFTIGGNGQLWQLLFAHGLVGTAGYLGFFGYALWRFRRDHSAIGYAGACTIAGSFLAMLWYNTLVTPLAFLLLAYVLLWRNARPPDSPAPAGVAP
jgi:hypothetical protein